MKQQEKEILATKVIEDILNTYELENKGIILGNEFLEIYSEGQYGSSITLYYGDLDDSWIENIDTDTGLKEFQEVVLENIYYSLKEFDAVSEFESLRESSKLTPATLSENLSQDEEEFKELAYELDIDDLAGLEYFLKK